jgi:shikimate kinase
LKLELEEIRRRITDMDTRGLVIEPGQGLDELYEKRRGLYEKWAEVTVEAAGLGHQQLLEAIIGALGEKGS